MNNDNTLHSLFTSYLLRQSHSSFFKENFKYIELKLKKVSTEQELKNKEKSSHHIQISEKQSKSPYTTPI